jgi:hypothetical protein
MHYDENTFQKNITESNRKYSLKLEVTHITTTSLDPGLHL